MARHKGLSFYRRRKKISSSAVRELFNWISGILISVLLAAVVVYLFGMTTNVVGISMEPTLYNEQQIYINRFTYVLFSPKQGDVVVFLPNGNENAHYYVKRVAARPGDEVLIEDGVLYVNGVKYDKVTDMISEPGIAENLLVMGHNEYFCIGDNVNNSEDSRSANIGTVNKSDIIGKVWLRMAYGQSKFGFVK